MDWIEDFDSDSFDDLFGGQDQRLLMNLEEEEEGMLNAFDSIDCSLLMADDDTCSKSPEEVQSRSNLVSTSSSRTAESMKTDRGLNCQQIHRSEDHSDCDQFSGQRDGHGLCGLDFKKQINKSREDIPSLRRSRGSKKGNSYEKRSRSCSNYDIQCPNEIANSRPVKLSGLRVSHSNHSMSRNAIIARENRFKKKKYEESLKATVMQLADENIMLKRRYNEKSNSIETLVSEVSYLRGVLANSTTLSTLLQNIPSCLNQSLSNIPITTSRLSDSKTSGSNLRYDTVTFEHSYAMKLQ